MSYLSKISGELQSLISASGIVPDKCVLVNFSPSIDKKIQQSLDKLKVSVVIGNAGITCSDGLNHEATFKIAVAVNYITSKYDVADIAEQIYNLVHNYNPCSVGIPAKRIRATSMSDLTTGAYVLTFKFIYIQPQQSTHK